MIIIYADTERKVISKYVPRYMTNNGAPCNGDGSGSEDDDTCTLDIYPMLIVNTHSLEQCIIQMLLRMINIMAVGFLLKKNY